jgi:hypothetical protein
MMGAGPTTPLGTAAAAADFGKQEGIPPNGWLCTPALAGKRGTAASGWQFRPARSNAGAFPMTPSVNPSWSLGSGDVGTRPLATTVSRRHTATIGNLGMRTQATRHIDDTAHLH